MHARPLIAFLWLAHFALPNVAKADEYMSCGDTPRLEPQFYVCQELQQHGGSKAFFYRPFNWYFSYPAFGQFQAVAGLNLNDWIVGFRCDAHPSGGTTSYRRDPLDPYARTWTTTRHGTIYVDHPPGPNVPEGMTIDLDHNDDVLCSQTERYYLPPVYAGVFDPIRTPAMYLQCLLDVEKSIPRGTALARAARWIASLECEMYRPPYDSGPFNSL